MQKAQTRQWANGVIVFLFSTLNSPDFGTSQPDCEVMTRTWLFPESSKAKWVRIPLAGIFTPVHTQLLQKCPEAKPKRSTYTPGEQERKMSMLRMEFCLMCHHQGTTGVEQGPSGWLLSGLHHWQMDPFPLRCLLLNWTIRMEHKLVWQPLKGIKVKGRKWMH